MSQTDRQEGVFLIILTSDYIINELILEPYI
jgi:hypothetical protein